MDRKEGALVPGGLLIRKGLSHDQIEKSGCMAAFLSEKRKKLGCGRVFLNYDVL